LTPERERGTVEDSRPARLYPPSWRSWPLVFSVGVARDLEPMGLPRHDHVQQESDTAQSCRTEARSGGRRSCRGHTAYQAATRAPPLARRHRNPSSTLRQLPRATSSSHCHLRTPHGRSSHYHRSHRVRPPRAPTTKVVAAAHAHQIWPSSPTLATSAWRTRGVAEAPGLPSRPPRNPKATTSNVSS
jgi:hypothetical protein